MFMNEDFKNLIQHSTSMLDLSSSELKQRYAAYALCLMNYIEKETSENLIEIRFDKEKATVSCLLDEEGKCIDTFLFLDNTCDEDALIDYLVEAFDYNFKKGCWIASECYIKTKETEDCTYFYCFK